MTADKPTFFYTGSASKQIHAHVLVEPRSLNISQVTFCFPPTNGVWISIHEMAKKPQLASLTIHQSTLEQNIIITRTRLFLTHTYTQAHLRHTHFNSLPAEAIIHYPACSLEEAAIQAHLQLGSLQDLPVGSPNSSKPLY